MENIYRRSKDMKLSNLSNTRGDLAPCSRGSETRGGVLVTSGSTNNRQFTLDSKRFLEMGAAQYVPIRDLALGVTGSTVAALPRVFTGAAFLGAAGVRWRVILVTLGDDIPLGALGDFPAFFDRDRKSVV